MQTYERERENKNHLSDTLLDWLLLFTFLAKLTKHKTFYIKFLY